MGLFISNLQYTRGTTGFLCLLLPLNLGMVCSFLQPESQDFLPFCKRPANLGLATQVDSGHGFSGYLLLEPGSSVGDVSKGRAMLVHPH